MKLAASRFVIVLAMDSSSPSLEGKRVPQRAFQANISHTLR
jgi:hypothetical protein